MATATSYDLGDRPSVRGARESLDNTLRRTAVESTPLFATLPRGPKAKAMLVEWVVDTLSEVSFPGVVDGAPLNYTGAAGGGFVDKTTDRTRFGARIQQIQRPWAVSPQANAVDVAGPNSTLAAQSKARCLIELKRDVEAMIGSDVVGVAGSGSAGDKCAGLGAWTNSGASASTDPYDSAAKQAYKPSAAQDYDLTGSGSLTEAQFRTILQATYEQGGSRSDYKLFGGPAVLNKIADMTRVSASSTGYGFQLTQDVGDGVLKLQVQEYLSDWGRIFIVPTLLAGRSSGGSLGAASRNRAYLIPGDGAVQIRFLEELKTIDLEDTDGGGARGLARTMCTITPTAAGLPLARIV